MWSVDGVQTARVLVESITRSTNIVSANKVIRMTLGECGADVHYVMTVLVDTAQMQVTENGWSV